MDSQRRILTWNTGAAEMYGWPKVDVIGKVLPRLLKTVAPISITEIDAILRREGRWEGELIQTARSGRRLYVDSRQVLFEGETGGLASWQSVMTSPNANRMRRRGALVKSV
jgi:PAS domain-containing protein